MEPTLPQGIAPKVPQEEMTMEQRIAAAKLLMVELEGALTDGVSHLAPDGGETLPLYRADILGLEAWLKAGRSLVIVARPGLAAAEALAQRLGAGLRTSGGDKDILFKQVTWENQVKTMETVYMGRDFDDLPALGLAGLAVLPARGSPCGCAAFATWSPRPRPDAARCVSWWTAFWPTTCLRRFKHARFRKARCL